MQIELEQIAGRRLRITARGLEIIVDDTAESGGPGDGFRPTELLMGALAACMTGTMLNFASDQSIEIAGVSVIVTDEVAQRPSRIGGIQLQMTVRAEASARQGASLRRVASACKIHNTLEYPPAITLNFEVA